MSGSTEIDAKWHPFFYDRLRETESISTFSCLICQKFVDSVGHETGLQVWFVENRELWKCWANE